MRGEDVVRSAGIGFRKRVCGGCGEKGNDELQVVLFSQKKEGSVRDVGGHGSFLEIAFRLLRAGSFMGNRHRK